MEHALPLVRQIIETFHVGNVPDQPKASLVEGNDFVTIVDVSWNEDWNGTEQRRRFRIEGDKLFIETAPAPSILFPGKTDFRRIVWEREK
jgi:hypothetical protein